MNHDNCTEVVVGGGWAGVYSLYRRVMDDPSRASSACLMEASWRIGGRTYSVPINHTKMPFVQDVGAYRFTPDMHMVGDLIIHQLDLPTECYQATCPSAKDDFPKPFMFNYSAPLRRIIDPMTKLPSGYATAIHRMVEELQDLGVQIFTQTKLIHFDLMESTENNEFNTNLRLTFQDTTTGSIQTIPGNVTANPIDMVVLNLPRNKLFDVKGVQESLSPRSKQTIECIVFDTPSDLFGDEIQKEIASAKHYSTNLGKAYLFYKNAFWRSKLNETVGTWPPDVGFAAALTPEDSCMGLLETYYSVSNETFYSSLPTSYDEPLGSVWETDGPEARALLQQAHTALVHSLKPLLEEDGIDSASLEPPAGLIVGIWHRPNEEFPFGRGYTAPTKVLYYPTESGLPDQACGVPGLTDDTYRDIVLQPWKEEYVSGRKASNSIRDRIFLVNNDYSCLDVRYYWGDWAEESLLQAERAMLLLGMSPPSWLLNKDYYHTNVVEKVYISHREMLPTRTSTVENNILKWVVLPTALVITIATLIALVRKRTGGKRQGEYMSIP
ncbi:flavin containing amine oxidoreductase [Nitzschia inconspicua]|uniref:Flavin containing amine oxidoreductase n=1 Tax=Nitzschia inconspicua TaxID=303405 RepID=A0A9K3LIY4_9STRA|nr:flavin containing amine oxidoreductase [Nitzschia inconspicua]